MMQGSLAEKLRVLRARMGLSLTEAAGRAGVTRDTLSDLEHGKRHPYMPTLSKIAAGYGVPVEDLLEEPAVPLADAPKEAGHTEAPGLFSAEHQATSGWRRAFDDSQRFRSRAKARLGAQLSLWETARDVGASDGERREFLDAMGRLLDEAKDVLGELEQNLGEGLDGMLEPGPSPYWTEYQQADTLYHELLEMVKEAGLSVRPKKTEQAPGQWRYELLEVA
jgi:transcriptional regulator with XRE-family HTH domain